MDLQYTREHFSLYPSTETENATIQGLGASISSPNAPTCSPGARISGRTRAPKLETLHLRSEREHLQCERADPQSKSRHLEPKRCQLKSERSHLRLDAVDYSPNAVTKDRNETASSPKETNGTDEGALRAVNGVIKDRDRATRRASGPE